MYVAIGEGGSGITTLRNKKSVALIDRQLLWPMRTFRRSYLPSFPSFVILEDAEH